MSAVAGSDGTVFRATTEIAGAGWASVFLDVPSFLLCGAQEVHEFPGVVVRDSHTVMPMSSHDSGFLGGAACTPP